MGYLSRRALCGAALAIVATPAFAGTEWIKCADGSRVKAGVGCLTSPITPTLAATASTTPGAIQYLSILSSTTGLSPDLIRAFGRDWRNYLISDEVKGRDYALKLSADKKYARFEYRPGDMNSVMGDALGTSRAELGGNRYGTPTRLPNGVPLWGAFQFISRPWSDPTGMLTKSGGVHGQIHMGSTAGGSPALAFRRGDDGQFKVTTRGGSGSSVTRYEKPLSFNQVHSLVYRVTLHPSAGALTVWLDGVKIVDLTNFPIGHSNAESYYNIGAYYAGGVTCPVVFEVGNHVDPKPAINLSSRITSPPVWGS